MNTINQICTGPIPAAGLSRRGFLNRFGMGLGSIALTNMINPASMIAAAASSKHDRGILGGQLHFPAKAKRVIYLFM
ncbi:MAG: sulfatase, partial [Verrucomicrobia bacterium]